MHLCNFKWKKMVLKADNICSWIIQFCSHVDACVNWRVYRLPSIVVGHLDIFFSASPSVRENILAISSIIYFSFGWMLSIEQKINIYCMAGSEWASGADWIAKMVPYHHFRCPVPIAQFRFDGKQFWWCACALIFVVRHLLTLHGRCICTTSSCTL